MSGIVERVLPSRLGRQFRRLTLAAWITNIGDGIGLAAGPLLIASLTRDPLLVALAPLLQQLPWLLFGLPAGVLADRLDRKRLLLAGNAVRLAALAVLVGAIGTDHVTIWLVLTVVFLFGTAETLTDTVSSTLTPMLVEKADLGVANARLLAGFTTLNQLAGPPIGAALFAAGTVLPFTVELVGLALGIVILSGLRLPAHGVEPEARGRVRDDILAGVRWLLAHAPLRTLALVMVSFNITFGAAWSVLVLYSQERLGMGDVGFGLLTTAGAVGGLVATIAYDRLESRFSLATLMKVCLTTEVFTHLAFALATRPWQGIAIMVVFGLYAFVWWTVSQTVRQRAVPASHQGRVSSVYLLGLFGGLVAGSFLGGLIARQWGIVAPFWFAFVGTGVILAVIWRQLPHIAHADEPAEAFT